VVHETNVRQQKTVICTDDYSLISSGAGTNLKVGGGHRSKAKVGATNLAEKQLFGCAPLLFGSKSTISRFGERFHGGQYSLVSFLFAVLLLTVPPCPAICKSGGKCPPCPMEPAPLLISRQLPLADEIAKRILELSRKCLSCSGKSRSRDQAVL